MHRPHRHLDGKRHHERHENQFLRADRQLHVVKVEQRKTAAGDTEEVNQGDQRQQRAHQRVEEKFDGGVHAVGAAPHPDNDEHRDQRRLEKNVEQQRIERAEHTVHEPGQDKESRHVLRHALLDHFPARNNHQHGGNAIEQYQQQRHAIDAEVVIDVEAIDPGRQFHELEIGHTAVEPRP